MGDSRTTGLYEKYRVERNDGKGITGGCIVLEFGDPNAWDALLIWANTVEADGYVQLAADVRKRVLTYQRVEEVFGTHDGIAYPGHPGPWLGGD